MRRGPIAVLIACALLVALALAWLAALPRGAREAVPAAPVAEREDVEPRVLAGALPEDSGRVQLGEPLASALAPLAPPPEGAFVPGPRPYGTLRIEVVDPEDVPVREARIDLDPDWRSRFAGPVSLGGAGFSSHAETDGSGAAGFEDLPAGLYRIQVRAPDHSSAKLELAWSGSGDPLRVQLQAARDPPGLLVRVVDAASTPVAGAWVELHGGDPGERYGTLHDTSDAEGIARFGDWAPDGAVVMAVASDGRVGMAKAWRRDGIERARRMGGLLVVVGAAGVLHGRLVGVDAAELTRARVFAYALDNAFPYYTTHGTRLETPVIEGRYRFDSLPAGTWSLGLEDPGGARLVLPPLDHGGPLENSVDPIEVEVLAGEESELDLEVRAGGVIEGVVRTSAGAPVEAALIRTTYAPRSSNFPDGFVLRGAHVWRFDSRTHSDGSHPASHANTRSAADGSYRLAGLQPGRHRLEVLANGLSYERREGLAVEDGELVRLEHVLEPGGEIQGINPGGGYLGVLRAGAEEPAMIAILPSDGRFAFAGLAAGDWRLAQLHSDESVTPVELAVVRVEARRTTWVDLSEVARPIRISGVVIDDEGPVAGVRVTHYPLTWTTDASGRFSASRSFAPSMWFKLRVKRDGIETTFELNPLRGGEREWDGELRIGSQQLRLRTLDAHGVPAPARVELQSREVEPDGTVTRSIRSDPFEVSMGGERAIGGLVRGEYELTARFANGAKAYATARLPAIEPLVLRAPASGQLTVRVRRASGEPAAGIELRASTWTGDGAAPEDSPTFHSAARGETLYSGLDGRAVFHGLAAGEVLVVARDERCAEIGGQRLRLGPDESPAIELVLGP